MEDKWIGELVREKGNILCPFCGKPFLKWDFQVITSNDCNHDIADVLQAYYMATRTLAEISAIQGSSFNMIKKASGCLMDIQNRFMVENKND